MHIFVFLGIVLFCQSRNDIMLPVEVTVGVVVVLVAFTGVEVVVITETGNIKRSFSLFPLIKYCV